MARLTTSLNQMNRREMISNRLLSNSPRSLRPVAPSGEKSTATKSDRTRMTM
jgi:hypothetical protein